MHIDLHGKRIKEVRIKTEDGEFNINNDGNQVIEMSATYHGDHEQYWVVYRMGNREISRFNCRLEVARITWL